MFHCGAGVALSALALPVDYMATGAELGTEWLALRLGWHNFAAATAMWGALVLPALALALRLAGQRRAAVGAAVLAWLSAFSIAPFLAFGAEGLDGLRIGVPVLLAGETAMLLAFLAWLRASAVGAAEEPTLERS
jgi:hypothetical protein